MSDSNCQASVWVDLYIESSDLTPDYITKSLGLTPSRVSLKGEPLGGEVQLGIRNTTHSFVVNVKRAVNETTSRAAGEMLESAIEEILLKVEPVRENLDALRPQISLGLTCFFGSKLPKPQWFFLSESLLKRLASLDLSVQVFWGLMKGEDPNGEGKGSRNLT